MCVFHSSQFTFMTRGLGVRRHSQVMPNPSGQGFMLASLCRTLKQFAIFGVETRRDDLAFGMTLR